MLSPGQTHEWLLASSANCRQAWGVEYGCLMETTLVVEFLRENAQRFGRPVEELETHLKSLGFRLFSITVGGLDAYAPVRELGVNVVAARSFDTVLPALRGPAAAHLLMRLAGIAPASS